MKEEEINRAMREDWDKRAQSAELAMCYIINGYSGSKKEFYESGLRHWLDMLGALYWYGLRPHGYGVEIGCGIGRMTVWMWNSFDFLFAIDVSPNMISMCPPLSKVEYMATGNLLDVPPQAADFILSHIVFQHVPKSIFWTYVADAARALKRDGVFCTQLHEGTDDYPDDETLLVRGYTVGELEALIDDQTWEKIAILEPWGVSETWKWLILRRR